MHVMPETVTTVLGGPLGGETVGAVVLDALSTMTG
jgi:hypothetical protein